MTYAPIPQPLLGVLEFVLHANLSANPRADLASWQVDHPKAARDALRSQLALYALTDAVDPGYFKRLTGHGDGDVASVQAWFTQVYSEYYGRPPEPYDIK